MLNKKFSIFFKFMKIMFFLYLIISFFHMNDILFFKSNFFISKTNFKLNLVEFNFIFLMSLTMFLTILMNKNYSNYLWKNLLSLVLIGFFLFFLTFTESLFIFFISYEGLLLTSSLMFKYSSPNKSSKKIFLYFMFWTQFSSALLWMGMVKLWLLAPISSFSELFCLVKFEQMSYYFVYFFMLSFFMKLPVYPFSFWLLKVHVEANTSFSMFLSGMLVKMAVFGLIKFQPMLAFVNLNFLMVMLMTSMALLTTSLNNQVDFKKFIAMTTMQEMSMMAIYLIFNGYITTKLVMNFMWLHTILSFMMFYFSEILYTSYKNSKVNSLLGLFYKAPKMNFFMNMLWLVFVGFPLFLKFFVEWSFLNKMIYFKTFLLITFIFFVQFLTAMIFTKVVFVKQFGLNNKLVLDMTKLEFLILTSLMLLLMVII